MGYVFEVGIRATYQGRPHVNVFHVYNGAEDQTPDDVADEFETGYIDVIKAIQDPDFSYGEISVKPLDVGNTDDPITRNLTDVGGQTGEQYHRGVHVWARLKSADNGFRPGGKMIGGLTENDLDDAVLDSGAQTTIETAFSGLITALGTINSVLAIYRPSISTPGFPNISEVAGVDIIRVSTNNRRTGPSSV